MENVFNISIRLLSNKYDFMKLKSYLLDYSIEYNKKGERHGKPCDILFLAAKQNVFLIKDIHSCSNIDGDCGGATRKLKNVIGIVESLIKDIQEDIERELYISGLIKKDQFGFCFDGSFIKFLAKHNYRVVFSSVILLE